MVESSRSLSCQHDAVKLLALGFVYRAGLQRLQVEADGSDRRLQFVRDRVDEGVVLFVSPDFTHQEGRIQNHAGMMIGQQQDAEEQQDSRAPVENYPTDVKKQGDDDQPGAERNEECDRLSGSGDRP